MVQTYYYKVLYNFIIHSYCILSFFKFGHLDPPNLSETEASNLVKSPQVVFLFFLIFVESMTCGPHLSGQPALLNVDTRIITVGPTVGLLSVFSMEWVRGPLPPRCLSLSFGPADQAHSPAPLFFSPMECGSSLPSTATQTARPAGLCPLPSPAPSKGESSVSI